MKVQIRDYSCWQYGLDANGGSYGYKETAVLEKGQIVDGQHWTTADFGFCRNCGSFETDVARHQEEWECTKYIPSRSMEFVAKMIARRRGWRWARREFETRWPEAELLFN